MADPLREACEFAAQTLSSDWPERCQEIVRRARAALAATEQDTGSVYRVWPEGTVQAVEDGAPYSHMSDDYMLVVAGDEEGARRKAGLV